MPSPVAAPEITVVVLASGSGGNATYVGDGRSGVLVDCGISARQVLDRMAAVGLGDAPVDGVLITHEHRDHVQGARVLSARLQRRGGRPVPFFMSPGTAAHLPPGADPGAVETIRPDEHLRLGSLEAWPFPILHDTVEPVAWRIRMDGVQVGVVTDLGRSTALVEQELAGLDVAVLESNHDEEMLLAGPYPWHLKQRIRSNHGHLSNDQTARLLEGTFTERLSHVVLAHLSQENNRPARALAAARGALRRAGRDDVRVDVASQFAPSAVIRLSPQGRAA